MKKFDFISVAPKTFIFQKDSNKTYVGGLLTIIFFFIVLVIVYSYIYEYIANPKYKVSFTYDDKFYREEELNVVYNDTRLYPELNYSITIEPEIIINNGNIKIITSNNDQIGIGNKYINTGHVPDINLKILYKCNKTNCTLRNEDMQNSYFPNL